MIRNLALAMSSTLLASATLEAGERSPTKNVVLVDGFGLIHTGWPFRSLRKRLEATGFVCLEPIIRPKDARHGIEPLAENLKKEIDERFGPQEAVAIVGFSMGGLISRYYLQNLGGSSRCTQLITISSPHKGTITAWLYPSRGAVQMRPNSEFLAALKNSEQELRNIQITSYRTPLDLMILPTSSSNWERAENLTYVSSMHHLMPHHRALVKDVVARLSMNSK